MRRVRSPRQFREAAFDPWQLLDHVGAGKECRRDAQLEQHCLPGPIPREHDGNADILPACSVEADVGLN
ncbi:MAG TPA: hypothetical protein VK864_17430, partial [Longimicrobiales bacterium]|nr:hypothetical protein [Longimicrobiales bacterium]